ncbi:MAG: hypothetical protein HY673_19035 [Chloroflexi bacterium]|nr:hypothetical protein [Chloroflexota bacterium]
MNFDKAFFVKLGKAGKFEFCIAESRLRFGFGKISVSDINNHEWGKIREQLAAACKGKRGLATRDLNVLRWICESTPENIWITFSTGTMWWARLRSGPVVQDKVSKYREVDGAWSNRDVGANVVLEINKLPGVLSKVQAFRGTVCRLGPSELASLKRIINDEPSVEHREIARCRLALANCVEMGIKRLHWKDFETLVDLVFRGSGWRRVSMLGGAMKYLDLELEDVVAGDRYLVQIKSQCTWDEFQKYVREFNRQRYRRLYFVVHTAGDPRLKEFRDPEDKVELMLSDGLSQKVVDLGLVGWLLEKIR